MINETSVTTNPTEHPERAENPERFRFGKRHIIILALAAFVVSLMVYLVLPGKKVAVTPVAPVQAENTTETSATSTDGYAINGTPPLPANATADTSLLTPATPDAPTPLTPATPIAPANSMNDQLGTIHQQLQSIETTLSSQGNSEVQAQIHDVITEISGVMNESTRTLSTAIQSSEQSLASQLDGMQGQLHNIQQLSQPGGYVDASNLPFTLRFIDNVSGQNVVTVSYNNVSTPLSEGESLAGWKLTTADYASQYAVFQNGKDQLVKVSNAGAR